MDEVNTGEGADALDRRPQLATAHDRAKAFRCPVVVSKLDCLSRDVAFVSSLMARKVGFIVAELGPEIDRFMLHIYAESPRKNQGGLSGENQRCRDLVGAKHLQGDQRRAEWQKCQSDSTNYK
jgi:hypothetical protein